MGSLRAETIEHNDRKPCIVHSDSTLLLCILLSIGPNIRDGPTWLCLGTGRGRSNSKKFPPLSRFGIQVEVPAPGFLISVFLVLRLQILGCLVPEPQLVALHLVEKSSFNGERSEFLCQ